MNNDILRRLVSTDATVAASATYQLTTDILKREDVLELLRKRLDEKVDDDLLEITVMRLGVRAKDSFSFDRFAELALHHKNPLVRQAAVFALASLGSEDADQRSASLLRDLRTREQDPDVRSALEKTIRELELR